MSGDSPTPARAADRPFQVMVKPNGPVCNIECEYCYYLEKIDLYPGTADFRMDSETLEAFVEQYIDAQPGPRVTFAWQGGEPTLLGVEFFREAVTYQEQYAPDDLEVVNTLQTNGTLLDDEWGEFFAANDFLVGISVDGPKPLHDAYRVTKGGEPTFDRVMDGLAVLKRHNVEFNVLTVVNSLNSHYPLELYRFFRDLGAEWIQFIPLVEELTPPDAASAHAERSDAAPDPTPGPLPEPDEPPTYPWPPSDPREDPGVAETVSAVADVTAEASVNGYTVDPEQYGAFLRVVFDEWVRNDVGEVSVQLFDEVVNAWMGRKPDLCVFNETCGQQLAVEHNGDLYSCDHFVEPGYRLGNLRETDLAAMVDSRQQRQFGTYKRDGLPEQCESCDVRYVCNGGCPKNRIVETPDGDVGLNFLCPAYRAFFAYVEPYMEVVSRVLERDQPPSLVPRLIRRLDSRAVSA